MVEHLGGPGRDLGQGPDQPGLGRLVNGAAAPRQGDGEASQNRQLGGEGLGRGDADLWPGIGFQDTVRGPRDGGFRHVDDGKNFLPPRLGVAQRRHGIRRLAGLGNKQRHSIGRQNRLPVAELGSDIDVDGKAGDGLKPVFGDQAGVKRRAASDNGQP